MKFFLTFIVAVQAMVFGIQANAITETNVLDSKVYSNIDSTLELMISKEEISEKVASYARLIESEYEGEELTIIMVLKGAICFIADFIRELKHPIFLESISASSYGNSKTSGNLKITGLEKVNIKGKNVLLIDDICDTGKTLYNLTTELKKQEPKSLKTLVLLSKNVKKMQDFKPDYSLFDIENRFVVGYGLDYKEYFRGLPSIYVLGDDA